MIMDLDSTGAIPGLRPLATWLGVGGSRIHAHLLRSGAPRHSADSFESHSVRNVACYASLPDSEGGALAAALGRSSGGVKRLASIANTRASARDCDTGRRVFVPVLGSR